MPKKPIDLLQGYSRLGGIGAAEAADLHARSGAGVPFTAAWRLADSDGDGRLAAAEFCLFMYLLKVCGVRELLMPWLVDGCAACTSRGVLHVKSQAIAWW